MKSMKGRIINKLKSISTITSLKEGLVFRTTNLPNQYFPTSSPPKECEKDTVQSELIEGGRITLSDKKDVVEEEEWFPENAKAQDFKPPIKSKEGAVSAVNDKEQLQAVAESLINQKCEINGESGGSALGQLKAKNDHQGLSDSTLLTCFKLTDIKEESKKIDANDQPEVLSSLREFEEKCPPGGNNSVILYTTSMRGIRKTFEDCTTIRFLLDSFRIQYLERDVSMHLEYREELWSIMGCRAVPPRLFIRGRYIGGADEVVGLHERGKLRKLLQGIPMIPNNSACNGCAGIRFVLCFNCNGSRKVTNREGLGDDEMAIRCPECNENGLVKCPLCSLHK